jgi:BlaI family transcriptional regulator, penicillinase repressor
MKSAQPSNLEMQVLSLLWSHGPLTARAVLDLMPDGKQRAYTTILSVLQVMEKKGLVKHEEDGNRHVYAPRVKRQNVLKPLLNGLVKTIFGGRPSAAMQHLLEASEVSAADLAEMRKLLDNYQPSKGEKQ